MTVVYVLIAWFGGSFVGLVAWGLWCSLVPAVRARRRRARFDRARDTLGRETL